MLKVLTATTKGKIGLACAVAVIGGGAATGGVVYHNAAVAKAEAEEASPPFSGAFIVI